MKQKKEVDEIYYFLKEYIRKHCDEENIIDRKNIMSIFGRCIHLPKEIRGKVLNNLVSYGYLIQVNRGRGKILYKVLG